MSTESDYEYRVRVAETFLRDFAYGHLSEDQTQNMLLDLDFEVDMRQPDTGNKLRGVDLETGNLVILEC